MGYIAEGLELQITFNKISPKSSTKILKYNTTRKIIKFLNTKKCLNIIKIFHTIILVIDVFRTFV